MQHIITLLTTGLLCLAFRSTRLTGVIGLTLLSLVYPPVLAVLLLLGGVGLYFKRRYW